MRRQPDTATCSIQDCPNGVARSGMCWTHLKRKKRNIPLDRDVRGYRMEKQTKLGKAIARYSAAESEEDFRRANLLVQKYASAGIRKEAARFVREAARQMLAEIKKGRG